MTKFVSVENVEPAQQDDPYTLADYTEMAGALRSGKCYVCGWPLDPLGIQCRPLDCSFRPGDNPTYATSRVRARKQYAMLSKIIRGAS